jgi:hypothetical protein
MRADFRRLMDLFVALAMGAHELAGKSFPKA